MHEAAFARPLDGVAPRGRPELTVDRPDMAMDRVVRHEQLPADLPFGKIAGQQFEHDEFPGCQLLIAVPGGGPRPRPEGG